MHLLKILDVACQHLSCMHKHKKIICQSYAKLQTIVSLVSFNMLILFSQMPVIIVQRNSFGVVNGLLGHL